MILPIFRQAIVDTNESAQLPHQPPCSFFGILRFLVFCFIVSSVGKSAKLPGGMSWVQHPDRTTNQGLRISGKIMLPVCLTSASVQMVAPLGCDFNPLTLCCSPSQEKPWLGDKRIHALTRACFPVMKSWFSLKIQAAFYMTIANPSRGHEGKVGAETIRVGEFFRLGRYRVSLAGETTCLHINTLARLTGTTLDVVSVIKCLD